jgi:hypothetical protein
MSITKTDKGWYCGTEGPFFTKLQAMNVYRRNHLSEYQGEEMADRAVVVFASTMLHSITCAHILHLKTTSYAAHMALGEYYHEVEDLIDAWIEAYQGKYGVIEKYENTFEQHDDALQYMSMMNDWLANTRKALPSDTELQNIVDEIVALIDSTIYKLKRFK